MHTRSGREAHQTNYTETNSTFPSSSARPYLPAFLSLADANQTIRSPWRTRADFRRIFSVIGGHHTRRPSRPKLSAQEKDGKDSVCNEWKLNNRLAIKWNRNAEAVLAFSGSSCPLSMLSNIARAASANGFSILSPVNEEVSIKWTSTVRGEDR